MRKKTWMAALLLGAGLGGAAAAHAKATTATGVPAPSPMTCTDPLVLGGADSCKDEGTWYEYAKADCAARGATAVVILSYFDSCGAGLWRDVKYECCD